MSLDRTVGMDRPPKPHAMRISTMHRITSCDALKRRRRGRHAAAFAACSAALVLAGCTFKSNFEVRGTVLDYETGNPVEGVRVELVEPVWLVEPTATNEGGAFVLPFSVPVGDAERRSDQWAVKLTADGYEQTTLVIGPVTGPENGGTTYIVLRTFLRPAVGQSLESGDAAA